MLNRIDYLDMQQQVYEKGAKKWLAGNADAIIGNHKVHTASPFYDEYLFKGLETSNLIALEYGCGPARNLINWKDRFSRIDGVDFQPVIETAKENLTRHDIPFPNLLTTQGDNIPCEDNIYDVVYSVICLQHICVHEIRYSIFKEIYRVLKPGGFFCAQMGMGRQDEIGQNFYLNGSLNKYLDNNFEATKTNGGADCSVEDEQLLINDLESIGFNNYISDITQPVTTNNIVSRKVKHDKWIWFKVKK